MQLQQAIGKEECIFNVSYNGSSLWDNGPWAMDMGNE